MEILIFNRSAIANPRKCIAVFGEHVPMTKLLSVDPPPTCGSLGFFCLDSPIIKL